MEDLNELERQRRLKLERIRAKGIDPYPPRAGRTHTTAQARALLEGDAPADAPRATTAGSSQAR